MASVGGVTCTFVSYLSPKLKTRMFTWVRPGIEGLSAQKISKAGANARGRAALYGTLDEATDWISSMRDLQATTVQIINDLQVSSTNILVRAVTEMRLVRAADPDEEAEPQYRASCTFETTRIADDDP